MNQDILLQLQVLKDAIAKLELLLDPSRVIVDIEFRKESGIWMMKPRYEDTFRPVCDPIEEQKLEMISLDYGTNLIGWHHESKSWLKGE